MKKIDPKAKKSLIITLIVAGGILFVGIAFFALVVNKSKQKSESPTNLPNMTSIQKVNNPNGTEIDGYASMSKSIDAKNAEMANSSGNAYVPSFAPPPETIAKAGEKKPEPKDAFTLYAQTPQAPYTETRTNTANTPTESDALHEKMLQDRIKRLDSLAASLIAEGYAPVSASDSWREKEVVSATTKTHTIPSTSAEKPTMLIKAGERAYVQIDTSINTDEPSPINATIISGAANGYTIFGTSRHNANDTISIEFTKMALPSGSSISIAAYAIDPKTGRTSVSGSVDHKIVERFVLPVLAATLGEYGKIVAQQGNQTTTSPLAGTSTTTNNQTRQQMRDAAIGTGIGEITGELSANSKAAKPVVTTERNLGIEVIFMQEVIIPNAKQ